MSLFAPTPRSGSFAPLLIVALTLVALLFFWTATRPPSIAEWTIQAREAILRGTSLPSAPAGVTVRPFDGKALSFREVPPGPSSVPQAEVTLVSASLDRKALGFKDRELLRLGRLVLPNGTATSGIHWGANPDWGLAVTGSLPIILPWTITASPPLMIPASESEILAFVASAGGSWLAPAPIGTATRLIDRLRVRSAPPSFVTPADPQESAIWLGPLFRAGKIPAIAGQRLPPSAFRLPAAPSLLPPATGILFEGIRLAPPPEISWDGEFRASLAGVATLAFLADIWERRSQTLATWLPALSDEIGPLLGSGFLRFNRPDLLPASATLFTPMDEITLLRAFHAAQADTGPVLWYPRPASPASSLPDPFVAIQPLSRRFASPEPLVRFLREHGNDSFDHFLWLESGDLLLDEIPGAGFRLILCGSGSITLQGPCTAQTAAVICRGGTITIAGGASRLPILLSLPDDNGRGGIVRFDHPATVTAPLSATVLELTEKSGTVFFHPEDSPDPRPLALLIPQS